MRTLLPLAVLLAALPTAEAAGEAVTLDVERPEVLDVGTPRLLAATLRACGTLGDALAASGDVRITTKTPPWLVAEAEPPRWRLTTALPGACATGRGHLRVNLTPDAPPLAIDDFDVEARDGTTGLPHATASVPFRVGLVSALAAHAPPEIPTTDGTARIPLHVEVGGNADVRLLVGVLHAPRGVAARAPPPHDASPGTALTLPIDVVLGDDAPRDPFRLRLTVAAVPRADATKAGDGVLLDILVRPPPPNDAPETWAAAAGALAAAAGFAARRRRARREE